MTNEEYIRKLNLTLGQLSQGNIDHLYNNFMLQTLYQNKTLDLLRRSKWTKDEITICDLLLKISNILYNNTTLDVLLLSDGVYDQLLQAYKIYNTNYQVGSNITPTMGVNNNEINNMDKKLIYKLLPQEQINASLYGRPIQSQEFPLLDAPKRLLTIPIQDPISKRMINTTHKYPQLVGTLDKCKFVTNEDARRANVYNDPNIQIFERDFLYQCIASGLITYDQPINMMAELKYDGVSVEAEVCGDKLISAYSRGDTGANIATDLTPILSNYRFYRASGLNERFGIKFEAVITYRNLERLMIDRGKEYKNGRNAMIGILSASDGYSYIDYITLIPISCSLDFSSYGINAREIELQFLNKYYATTEMNRYVRLYGNYVNLLYQVREFTMSAEIVREALPYMIDGVVLSFMDKYLIDTLGRINSVNKWQMAIKFNPRESRTIFQGYTFSIGKSGEVIPMAHFAPVEFIGTIHTKQTIHSFQRYKELALIKGQEIDITYVNDVLTYISKPDTIRNRQLQSQYLPEPFIEKCPFCGSTIELSKSMKSARCPNMNCHERRIMRMVDMLSKLGFKEISDEVIRILDSSLDNGFTSLVDLVIEYDEEKLEKLIGPLTSKLLISYMDRLRSEPIRDYELMGALNFDGMGSERWKLILSHYNINTLFGYTYDQLIYALKDIKGIGPEIIKTIYECFQVYRDEMILVTSGYLKIISSNSIFDNRNMPKVVLTGFRDADMMSYLYSKGYDANGIYSVTKDTAFVIAQNPNSNSTKLQKARKYNIPIISLDQFKLDMSKNLPIMYRKS